MCFRFVVFVPFPRLPASDSSNRPIVRWRTHSLETNVKNWRRAKYDTVYAYRMYKYCLRAKKWRACSSRCSVSRFSRSTTGMKSFYNVKKKKRFFTLVKFIIFFFSWITIRLICTWCWNRNFIWSVTCDSVEISL